MPAVYLDCNATTPIELQVLETTRHFMGEEYGNAGSRTHQFGARAKKAAQASRSEIASLVGSRPEEVVFTSGATESNNLALLGLESHAEATRRRHVVTTAIEHKAVLEPLEVLESRGLELTVVPSTEGGWVDPEALEAAIRPDTLLVSVMHINNETGVIQPISEIASKLADHEAFFHVDPAQGFGKYIHELQNKRIDLISLSAHKIYGPKGVGALIARRRGYDSPPLGPLMFGGGQERGVRPGTLPVALVAGFGEAAAIAAKQHSEREKSNLGFRQDLWNALEPLEPMINGDPDRCVPHCINVSFEGIDSEAAIVALKDIASISNGSACTSQSYEPSHVLEAMGLDRSRILGALRISWCHMTQDVDWDAFASAIRRLR